MIINLNHNKIYNYNVRTFAARTEVVPDWRYVYLLGIYAVRAYYPL